MNPFPRSHSHTTHTSSNNTSTGSGGDINSNKISDDVLTSLTPLGSTVLNGLNIDLHGQRADNALNDLMLDIYDSSAWSALISELVALHTPIRYMRVIYERLLSVYPTSGKYWQIYIETEMSQQQYHCVDQLFQRSLLQCYDMELWLLYIQHVRRVKSGMSEEVESVEAAYEYTLQHMGMDMNSTIVYRDYILYVKQHSPSDTESKHQKIRSIYQRAVVQPINDVDILFREWDAYEHSIDKDAAADVLTSYNEKFIRAKLVSRERKKRRAPLLMQLLSRPTRDNHVLQQRDTAQLTAWKRYILYEKHNQQRLDMIQFRYRVIFAYKQALIPCRHIPELWHDYATFVAEYSHDDAVRIYQQAVQAMPYSMVMHLLYADYLEQRQHYDDARKIYTDILLKRQRTPQPYVHWPKQNRQGDIIQDDSMGVNGDATTADDGTMNGIIDNTRANNDEEVKSIDVNTRTDDLTKYAHIQGEVLAWINYMRFSRRVNGADSARRVFLAARKNDVCHDSYQLYIAASTVEWMANRDALLAGKILSNAMNKFTDNMEFMTHYLHYLQHINDQNNMRVILERVFSYTTQQHHDQLYDTHAATQNNPGSKQIHPTGTTSSEHPPSHSHAHAFDDKHKDEPLAPNNSTRLHQLWNQYVDMERWTSPDLQSINTAEQRRDDALEQKPHTIGTRIDRYHFLDLYPCTHSYRVIVKNTAPSVVESGLALLTGREAAQASSRDNVQAARSLYARPDVTLMVQWDPNGMLPAEREKLRDIYSSDSNYAITPNPVLDLLSQFFHKPYAAPDVDMNLLMNAIHRIPDRNVLQNIQLPHGMLLSEQRAAEGEAEAQENGITHQRDGVLGKRVKNESGIDDNANGAAADSIAGGNKEKEKSSVAHGDPHRPPPVEDDLFAQERPKRAKVET